MLATWTGAIFELFVAAELMPSWLRAATFTVFSRNGGRHEIGVLVNACGSVDTGRGQVGSHRGRGRRLGRRVVGVDSVEPELRGGALVHGGRENLELKGFGVCRGF
ncbi:MAG: hypothetical protein OXU63_16520 [Acidobacteriota bacterium]|nr:hypothetical protein [Acidobacteriota bacterium]